MGITLYRPVGPKELALMVDLAAGAQHSPAYRALSGTGRIPTLVGRDFSLSESSAISEYLDDAYPGRRLYPADLKARAKAREVQAWLRSDLMAVREERSTHAVFYGLATAPLSNAALAAAEKLFAAAGGVPVRGVVHRGHRPRAHAEPPGARQ